MIQKCNPLTVCKGRIKAQLSDCWLLWFGTHSHPSGTKHRVASTVARHTQSSQWHRAPCRRHRGTAHAAVPLAPTTTSTGTAARHTQPSRRYKAPCCWHHITAHAAIPPAPSTVLPAPRHQGGHSQTLLCPNHCYFTKLSYFQLCRGSLVVRVYLHKLAIRLFSFVPHSNVKLSAVLRIGLIRQKSFRIMRGVNNVSQNKSL